MIAQRFSQIFWFHGTAHTRSILILLHQQRKGFQRKWSHFPGSGRQSQIMQTTIRCHCHTATTPQPQICLREKNLPEKKIPKKKKSARNVRKKTTIRCCCPYNHTSAANMKRKLIQFIQKAGFHYFYKHLQSAPKEEGRRFIQYLLYLILSTHLRL